MPPWYTPGSRVWLPAVYCTFLVLWIVIVALFGGGTSASGSGGGGWVVRMSPLNVPPPVVVQLPVMSKVGAVNEPPPPAIAALWLAESTITPVPWTFVLPVPEVVSAPLADG